eukprot:TRINITY_DN7076_c0_g1_i1.p1 TRINITY_DN7076_c0_g1~~TRINITY_DN7076_c0_g1_i1.p1  ORF type:complete len:473 (-),score=126.56 TRINITY_DN7076_c0_g1_i1:19-1437(-)
MDKAKENTLRGVIPPPAKHAGGSSGQNSQYIAIPNMQDAKVMQQSYRNSTQVGSKQSMNLIKEFLTAEDNYVQTLKKLSQHFVEPSFDSVSMDLLKEEEVRAAFSNIREIISFHNEFYKQLSTEAAGGTNESLRKFVDIWMSMIDRFLIYGLYRYGTEESKEAFQKLQSNPGFSSMMEYKRIELKGFFMDEALNMPLKRINEYPVFLSELVKSQTGDMVVKGLYEKMNSIAKITEETREKARKNSHKKEPEKLEISSESLDEFRCKVMSELQRLQNVLSDHENKIKHLEKMNSNLEDENNALKTRLDLIENKESPVDISDKRVSRKIEDVKIGNKRNSSLGKPTDDRTDSLKKSTSVSTVRSGWLTKQGGPTRRNWKRRWFVLLPDALVYYKDPSEGKPQGTIPFSQCSVVSKSDVKPFCFLLPTAAREYYMFANSDEECDIWMRDIEDCLIRQSIKRKESEPKSTTDLKDS